MQSGLYIVGTPIGNLGDMSARAIDVLRAVDVIACEDTRVFGKLAEKFDIKTKRIAYHDYNEAASADGIISQILDGKRVALVSDSGMPGVSDPGYRVIRAARAAGIYVTVVPGACAAIAALVLSGFPTDRFTFCGFFKDEKHLAADNKLRHTIIYYESPNRVKNTIEIMARIMPERRIAIVREITKMFEEIIIGYPAEIISKLENIKGEIVIVVEPAPDVKMSDDDISEIVRDVISGGQKTKDAAAEIAARTGISKSDAYDKVVESRK